MIRDTQTLLAYEMKRKPDLAAWFACLKDLSAEDIDALPTYKWVKQAFLEEKSRIFVAEFEKHVNRTVVDTYVSDESGVMRCWTGPEMWLPVSSAVSDGGTSLLITPGTLFWVSRAGIWIDTVFMDKIDPRLKQFSNILRTTTRSEYIAALRERRNALPLPTSSPDTAPAVRIYRPG